MGCFHGGGSMLQGLSRAESNAKAALASSETGSMLVCFAPKILFSFSLKRYWGFTGTFGHSNRKWLCPTLTLLHLTSLGSYLKGRPWRREGSWEEDRDAGAGGEVGASLLPLPLIQKPVSSCLPSTGWIHQPGNGFAWDLVGPSWEASYLCQE